MSNDPRREPRESGYRGALPPRNDTLAKPWIMIVAAVVVLMFVLSALSIPSRFEPDPTPRVTASPSASPSASPTAGSSASAPASGSGEPSASAAASTSAEASMSASASP